MSGQKETAETGVLDASGEMIMVGDEIEFTYGGAVESAVGTRQRGRVITRIIHEIEWQGGTCPLEGNAAERNIIRL